MKKKAVFIIPYFGNFPPYFQLTLNSMGKNKAYDWIIFTDNEKAYQYPKNVKIYQYSFAEMKEYIQDKYDFSIAFPRPYKFCDLRPMYGYIFKDYIEEYDFWGHCDIDCIFGQLDHFFKDEIWNNYDKIFELGHMTLYRNTEENNRRYMLPLNERSRYQEVLTSSENVIFDEGWNDSICNIFFEYKFPVWREHFCADIAQKSSFFRLAWLNSDTHKYVIGNRRHQVFWWDKGILKLSYIENGEYKEEEKMYIHLIRRTGKMKVKLKDMDTYKIIPHAFEDLELPMNEKNFKKIKWWHMNLFYFEIRFGNLKSKIKKRFGKKL